MVWGPPGTGKTRVLARAITDLVRSGRRVLLVSTANIAVDNALKEVIKHLDPAPGVVVRVGTPHLPELATNDDVQSHRLAARTTTEVDAERLQVQDQLTRLATVDTTIRELEESLADYDHDAYLRAERRIVRKRALEGALVEQRAAESEQVRTSRELSAATAQLQAARVEWERVEPERGALVRAQELRARLAQLNNDLRLQRADVERLTHAVNAGNGGWFARRRQSRKWRNAVARLNQFEQHVAEQHQLTDPLIAQCLATARSVTEEYVRLLGKRIKTAHARLAAAKPLEAEAARRLREIRTKTADLVRRGVATAADHDLVVMATEANLPSKWEELEKLRPQQEQLERDQSRLEAKLRRLNERIAALRKDAEGEIIAEARVVATTLARSRAHSAVARESIDVVLVDEAGAAVVGEVLLAVSQATRTAALLGDFLQLGPVTVEANNIDNPPPCVQKWLKPDGFTHCGIRTADDVPANPGCVGLLHQFRFGPNLRKLANDVVYGVLRDGVTEISGRPPEDTEVVLVDVHGLPGLNQMHRSSRRAGWWPVGALLSRSLRSTTSWMVAASAWCPRSASRSRSRMPRCAIRGQNLSVPVGTAHSFQGREFDTVIFDLVEDGQGWIAVAKWGGNDFERSGVRLFGVGITRARKRLYVIADAPSRQRGTRKHPARRAPPARNGQGHAVVPGGSAARNGRPGPLHACHRWRPSSTRCCAGWLT